MPITARSLAVLIAGLAGASLWAAAPAMAQEAETAFAPAADTTFIFNTFLFLVMGFLVMWMAAGFAMLEAGMVRTKSVASICTKNIALYSVAGILYYLVGYNLMYTGVDGGFFGSVAWFVPDDTAALETGYSASSDWFFQMVFVATAASIVSGTIAERAKLWPFILFVVILTGVLYPIQGSWTWGGGWLSELGFSDFAGSTIVHSVGGWAALAGALIIGARKGRFGRDGSVHAMPGSSLPMATLGTFILWLGWFGFNGGSQLALGTVNDAISVSQIFANTNLAAAGGVIAAMIATQLLYKKVDLTMAMNGALGGLVSITAEPLTPVFGEAILIGAVGGILVVFAVPMLDKFKIDDVVGAIPVHLVCGIWGTLAVPLTNPEATFSNQIIGIGAVAIFVFTASAIVWTAIKMTIGVRLDAEEEAMGSDLAELGLEAYPEFGHGSQRL